MMVTGMSVLHSVVVAATAVLVLVSVVVLVVVSVPEVVEASVVLTENSTIPERVTKIDYSRHNFYILTPRTSPPPPSPQHPQCSTSSSKQHPLSPSLLKPLFVYAVEGDGGGGGGDTVAKQSYASHPLSSFLLLLFPLISLFPRPPPPGAFSSPGTSTHHVGRRHPSCNALYPGVWGGEGVRRGVSV